MGQFIGDGSSPKPSLGYRFLFLQFRVEIQFLHGVGTVDASGLYFFVNPKDAVDEITTRG
ncbi:hypothetical protein SI65_08092 [Aspergillus cristatus]|uniref:Uncharacterized protein n=1 Tax=Aspergillus cristatus TaxID=573508 RepID=A0A1E3B6I8_ASPCR|nr:hypothetical protein SI65_08092 [Aspergillus cristatus]